MEELLAAGNDEAIEGSDGLRGGVGVEGGGEFCGGERADIGDGEVVEVDVDLDVREGDVAGDRFCGFAFSVPDAFFLGGGRGCAGEAERAGVRRGVLGVSWFEDCRWVRFRQGGAVLGQVWW